MKSSTGPSISLSDDMATMNKGESERPWRLWQIESALACPLDCLMCPWKKDRSGAAYRGLMPDRVWDGLARYLSLVDQVDLSGGGEPLLAPRLIERLGQSKAAGCRAGFLTNGQLLTEDAARALVDLDLDWIGFSVDGAEAATYESIRRGAEFRRLTDNISRLARLRTTGRPRIILQMVCLPDNIAQVRDLVMLAHRLGADQVNFKQCDVIRSVVPKGLSLFQDRATKDRARFGKQVNKAAKLARKLGLAVTAFGFEPDQLPVCDMEPARSAFIGHDGRVSPCINLAYGGESSFFGRPTIIPTVIFGRLPEDDLAAILTGSPLRRGMVETFEARLTAYNQTLARQAPAEPNLMKLNQAFERAKEAMPPAPEGCRECHYLFDV